MKEVSEIWRRLGELERRVASMIKHGTVTDVDPGDGSKPWKVRLRLNPLDDPLPLISPWVPYAQIAGDLKVHHAPYLDQEMTLLCPAGDFRQAVAIPLTWSDKNPSPSRSDDEQVITFGQMKITLKRDSLRIEAGDKQIIITTEEIRTIGPTRIGMDNEQEPGARIGTVDGIAEQAYAQPGGDIGP